MPRLGRGGAPGAAFLFGLAMGAVFAVFTPDDDVVTPSIMTVILRAACSTAAQGVRDR